jgi:sugar phosphate isomerase/epimerase
MASIVQRTTYHAVYDESVLDALRFALENGFSGVQAAAELPHLSPLLMSPAVKQETAEYRRRHGLLLSLHAPDDAAGLCCLDPDLDAAALTYLTRLFNAAEELGVHCVTLHVGATPQFGTDEAEPRTLPEPARAAMLATLEANLRRVAGMAAGRCLACIENQGLDDAMASRLRPLVRKHWLWLAHDLAKPDPGGFFAQHAWAVRQVHLHVRAADGRSHAALGPGCESLLAHFRRLEQHDVREYCIEVRPRERALASLTWLREATEQEG